MRLLHENWAVSGNQAAPERGTNGNGSEQNEENEENEDERSDLSAEQVDLTHLTVCSTERQSSNSKDSCSAAQLLSSLS